MTLKKNISSNSVADSDLHRLSGARDKVLCFKREGLSLNPFVT